MLNPLPQAYPTFSGNRTKGQTCFTFPRIIIRCKIRERVTRTVPLFLKTYGLKERNHHNRKERCRFVFSKVLGIDKKTAANTLRVFLAKFIEGLVSLVS